MLSGIKSSSIDVIIADPLYNLGKDYGNDSDKKCFDSYLNFSKKWINECHRILKPTGTIYIFTGVRFISYLHTILEQEHKMIFNSWITWHYTQGVGKTKGFSPRHEDVLMFTKTKDFRFNIDNIRIPQKHYRSINNMDGQTLEMYGNFRMSTTLTPKDRSIQHKSPKLLLKECR